MRPFCFLIFTSLSLSACTAHVGYHDIGTALRSGFGNQQAQTSYASNQRQKASTEECAVHATARAAQNALSALSAYKNNIVTAKANLASSPAWQNGSCVRPVMRKLPPRPETLPASDIQFQAVASCVDISSRRQGANEMAQALMAVRQEKLLSLADKWNAGHQEPCAVEVSQSLMDDFIIRAICGAFGREAYASCLLDQLKKCAQTVASHCEAPLAGWKQEVEAIQNEPERLFQDCQSSLRQIEEAEREIPKVEMIARLNQEEHDKLASSGRRQVPASACY